MKNIKNGDRDKLLGFTLTFVYQGEKFPDQLLYSWINTYFFFRGNFLHKILYAQPEDEDKVIMVFDASANLFDIMQNINCGPIMIKFERHNYKYQITSIEIDKNDTKLSVLELSPPHTSPFIDLKTLDKHLSEFGLIFAISREKKQGVCTGVIRALMILYDDSKIPEADEIHGNFKLVPYLSHMFDYWTEETTTKFQEIFCAYTAKRLNKTEAEGEGEYSGKVTIDTNETKFQ